MVGLDTGFFVRLLRGDPAAREVWERLAGGEEEGAVSCISLYEIAKLGLKGALAKEAAETLLEELPHLCRIVWLDGPDLVRRAAHLAHGNGLAMADAIILASLMEAGAGVVYTTDSDLTAYAAGPRVVVL